MKHRKRKIAALLLSLLLMLLAVGGTWAYFTKAARATNVITTGTVELALSGAETGGNDDAAATRGTARVSRIMPGTTVDYQPEIQNVGTAAFYLRVKADVGVTPAEGEKQLDSGVVTLTYDEKNWTLQDGWYYYTKAVNPAQGDAPGKTVTPFSAIQFSPEMGNEYQGCTVDITVEAQAVQVKNNEMAGSDVTTIKGWPAATGGDTTPGTTEPDAGGMK